MQQAWCSHLGVVRLAGSAGSWRRAEHDDGGCGIGPKQVPGHQHTPVINLTTPHGHCVQVIYLDGGPLTGAMRDTFVMLALAFTALAAGAQATAGPARALNLPSWQSPRQPLHGTIWPV
jgi:hypothetical protein